MKGVSGLDIFNKEDRRTPWTIGPWWTTTVGNRTRSLFRHMAKVTGANCRKENA
jgi:hypothetical protein